MSDDDTTLVRSILDGDDDAFGAFVERYADPMSAVAWLTVRHREDARDVVQQAFFEAYRGMAGLRDPARLGAWLRGIVVNLARDVVRKRGRVPIDVTRPRTTGPEEHAMRRERATLVVDVLDRLDELHREVVILHHVEGLRVREVAGLVDRPEGSVKRMLSEARDRLKRELIDMAREEFTDHRLTDEQRARLARISSFPRKEPVIRTEPTDEPAPEVLARAPSAVFPELKPGAEACFATYDHPGGKLTGMSHVRVEGPVDVAGKPALRYDHVDFGPDRDIEWCWAPHYRVNGEVATYCAKSFGKPGETGGLILPDDPDWGEPAPRTENLRLTPGTNRETGVVVDDRLWSVKIGRRKHRCVRRLFGGSPRRVDWTEDEVTDCALEEFLLTDGRLLLFRRYNGTEWTARNPGRASQESGWIETLAAAGMPEMAVFGHRYRLWYDQVPNLD
jgi:RNA polymerase sigma-70 factor, ECF subfamily